MPGKTSQASKQESRERLKTPQSEASKTKVSIWPLWTEAELAAEDFGGAGKGKDKSRASQLYEDPEEIVLPPSLTWQTPQWKRPTDPEVAPTDPPVVVRNPDSTDIDLVSANSHLLDSELMAWIVSQLGCLWRMRHRLSSPATEGGGEIEGGDNSPPPPWHPWDHIYLHPKGAPPTQTNPGGKYCVRLYWMGAWRKVNVDDRLPYVENTGDTIPEEGEVGGGEIKKKYCLLLPATADPSELWPAILTKAILKIAALDYDGGGNLSEFGDCSVVHMLTGWTMHTLPTRVDSEEMWEKLLKTVTLWERPDEEEEGEGEEEEEEEGGREKKMPAEVRNTLIFATFTSCQIAMPLRPSLEREINTSERLLREAELIPENYSLRGDPSFPMLLTQVRDEPLELPPTEAPLPKLQAPFYLGLVSRKKSLEEQQQSEKESELKWVEVVHPLTTAASDEDDPHYEKKWMKYNDFTKAFKSLLVFRNPTAYANTETYSDLSGTVENTVQSLAGGKKAGSSPRPPSPQTSNNILFVDSVNPVQLHFMFSSISNWREGKKNLKATKKRSLGLNKQPLVSRKSSANLPTGKSSRHDTRPLSRGYTSPDLSRQLSSRKTLSRKGSSPVVTRQLSRMKKRSSVRKDPPPSMEMIAPGNLVVEPYSWRSLKNEMPVLRIPTTGTKGAVLKLVAGRHIFKLHATAPIGYHLQVYSDVTDAPLILTNEEGVFAYLTKESRRFLHHATTVVMSLIKSLRVCGNDRMLRTQIKFLVGLHKDKGVIAHHYKVLQVAIFHVLHSFADVFGLTPKMLFAWKALVLRVLTSLQQAMATLDTPSLENSASVTTELDAAVKRLWQDIGTGLTVPESWIDREATPREEHAATVVQKWFLHKRESRLRRAMTVGSPENKEVLETLEETVQILGPHVEAVGIEVFKRMFKLDPGLLKRFPFYKDEWLRAFYQVVTGPFPALQPNSWCVVFREVFDVPDSQLVVAKLHCPISTCQLRIINNDTGEEVPRVFNQVVPSILEQNKGGYTFFADAWTLGSEGVEGGKLRVQVVSSSSEPPVRIGRGEVKEKEEEVDTTFYTHELQDYCLPNRDHQLFRYTMKVTKECPVTVQLSTSKHDVYFKLEVLDREQPVATAEGRGHGVIPLCFLHPPAILEEEGEKTGDLCDLGTDKPHKYIVQATVLRDSWPVNETAWPYISMIKSMEKPDEAQGGADKQSAKKGKGKEKGGKKTSTPLPAGSGNQRTPPQTDTSKPHWTMKIVTKSSDKECLEVAKDTEREDELKSMVQAWEANQPGRCKKAEESRMKYLETHALREASHELEEEHSTAASIRSETSSDLPHPPTGPVPLKELDLSPFLVKAEGPPRLLDEAEQALRQQERQTLFKEYRSKRQAVLQVRNADREKRNDMKTQQLELVEQWQTELDELRNNLNAGREAIRERHLAQERAKREAEQAALRAQQEQSAGGRTSKAKKGKKK